LVANKYTLETDPLVKGTGAMTYANSNQIVAQWTAAGATRNLKLWPLPRTTKPTNYYKPSMFFSITTGSKHPKEAAMFIDYFTNDLEANKVLAAERGVPIAAHVRDGMKATLSKAAAEMFDYITRLEGNTSPIPMPDPAGHPDIVNNVWTPLVADAVGYGQTTPEKAIATLRTEATTILAKNKK
jgi:multiple sugar transport system substrate-binding protein